MILAVFGIDDVLAFMFSMAVTTAIAWAIGEALKKKTKIPSARPQKFEMPDIEEGRPYGVIFGTPKLIMNPTVAWWGDVSTRAIVRHYTENKWGNNKRVYYTVGYHYSAGIHFKLCHGPIDGVKQIRVGEKVAWPNPDDPTELAADGATSISINEPNLFGGEEKEGGLVGDIDIQYGYPSQTVNSYLLAKLTGITAQDLSPIDMAFSADGTKMYVVGNATNTVFQYLLLTAWDISTAGYASKYKSVAAQDNNPCGLAFSSDGSKMYIIGYATDTVYQYALSTAWDISTASYASKSINVSSQDTGPFDVGFSSDGTKMYVLGSQTDSVYQYTLSTAWDISTASYASKSNYIGGQEVYSSGLAFSSDGSKMYVLGLNSDTVYQYTVATAWDVSTAVYASKSKYVGTQDPNPYDFTFSVDGLKMYVVGYDSDLLYQYTLGTAWDVSTATYDSQWGESGSSTISASRGLVSVILKGVESGTSPYPKAWSFLPKRTQILDDGTPQWYLAKADISGDLNAAHVLRECYTCTGWGLGYSASLIDTSWTAAADTLYTEGFGVSRHWHDANESIEDLIKDVLETIDGKIYSDPETGLFVLKLARAVLGELETFDESDIESLDDFGRPLYGEIPDVVNVCITDVLNNTVTSIPDHDIAVMDLQGGKSIAIRKDFFAITKPALGGKVAGRLRQQITSMLAMMTIKGKRTMAHLRPYDVFKLSYPARGAVPAIVQLVVRVIDANYGTLENGQVILHCTEDVFATQDAIFSAPPATGWTDPVSDPAAAPNRLLLETPFWTLVHDAGISGALALDSDAGFLLVAAQKPSNDALDYELLVRDSPTGDFIADGRGYFTPTATLAETMPLNAAEQIVDLANIVNLNQVAVNTYAMVGSEILKVTAVDITNSRVTLARGVLDTVPAAHSITDRIWFLESVSYMVGNEYTVTNQPGVKILPRTAKGQYAEGSATAYNADAFDSRAIRPYPPGNFKINAVSYPSSFSGEPTITWAHRDRTQQITELVEHDAAGIGPEAGVTYTLKIYDAGDTLRHTETGLTGTSYTYPAATEVSECGSQQSQLRFVLYSVRDGYDSWQSYDLTVPRAV